MPAIPERVWEFLTEEEAANLRAIMAGWRYEPNVTCPRCQANIGIRLKVQATATDLDARADTSPVERLVPETPRAAPNATMAENERALLESAERSGLMKAFTRAVHEAKQDAGLPSNMAEFFLTFLRSAVAKRVPAFVINRFNDEFDGHLAFWGAQGVLAVSVDGMVRMFVPLSFIAGPPVTSIGTKVMKGRLHTDGQDLEVWVKGRYGYVPLSSENYLDAMKRKNIGKFCEFVQ